MGMVDCKYCSGTGKLHDDADAFDSHEVEELERKLNHMTYCHDKAVAARDSALRERDRIQDERDEWYRGCREAEKERDEARAEAKRISTGVAVAPADPETMCDGCMCSWCVETRRKAHEYDEAIRQRDEVDAHRNKLDAWNRQLLAERARYRVALTRIAEDYHIGGTARAVAVEALHQSEQK